jgi:predicted secreted Zn-dependent protease
MMLGKIAVLLGILATTGCATSSTVTTGYYDITGSDDRALDRSISKLGPMGGHAFAATEIQILPVKVLPVETATGCKIGSASFKIKANMILPRWKDRSKADPALRAGFDNYADYALIHEKVHVRIGEAAAIAMGEAVKQIPEQKNCDELYRQVKLTVAKIQKKHSSLQLEFDASEKKRIGLLLAQAN